MVADAQRPTELTINATESAFADWLNSYGKAAQGRDFIPRGIGWDEHRECGGGLVYGIIHPLNPRESVFVEVEATGAELLRLVAMLCGVTTPTDEAERYFAALVDAIYERFGTHPSTRQEDDRDLVRRAQYIKQTTGNSWEQIANQLGITDRQLRTLRNRYGDA